MSKCMLTTVDNPYNPYTNFSDWYLFDVLNGYNSCGFLMRVAKVSDAMSDEEQEDAIEKAIDDIVRYDPLNLYMKIKESKEPVVAEDWERTLELST